MQIFTRVGTGEERGEMEVLESHEGEIWKDVRHETLSMSASSSWGPPEVWGVSLIVKWGAQQRWYPCEAHHRVDFWVMFVCFSLRISRPKSSKGKKTHVWFARWWDFLDSDSPPIWKIIRLSLCRWFPRKWKMRKTVGPFLTNSAIWCHSEIPTNLMWRCHY